MKIFLKVKIRNLINDRIQAPHSQTTADVYSISEKKAFWFLSNSLRFATIFARVI